MYSFSMACLATLPVLSLALALCAGRAGSTTASPACADPATLLWSSACQAPCSLCLAGCVTSCQDEGSPPCLPSCPATACNQGTRCQVDGYVGSYLIHEDTTQRVWNFTLEPGQMTSMHRHDYDYTFVVIRPSTLEVFGEAPL